MLSNILFPSNCCGRGELLLTHVAQRHILSCFVALSFSCDGKYFASLGGQDDNSVVVWETETGRAVCGSPAAQDSALSVKWLHRRNDRFVTAGNFHLRVWQVDVSVPKVTNMERRISCSSVREVGCLTVRMSGIVFLVQMNDRGKYCVDSWCTTTNSPSVGELLANPGCGASNGSRRVVFLFPNY